MSWLIPFKNKLIQHLVFVFDRLSLLSLRDPQQPGTMAPTRAGVMRINSARRRQKGLPRQAIY